MLLSRKRAALLSAAAAALFVSAMCAAAQGQTDQDEDNSRGVRIIAAPTPSPAEKSPPAPNSPNDDLATPAPLTPATPVPAFKSTNPPSVTPAAPTQAVATPSAGVPLTPAIALPQNEATAPPVPTSLPPPSGTVAKLPSKADTGVGRSRQDLEALASGITIPNAARLSMKILPGPEIAAGSQVSFSVSSKKEGYLILIDVDATGKLAQIFPNPMSLMAPGTVREQSNFLRPGRVLQIPDPANPYSGFEFIASPPTGTAMLVALLSDRPVQLVDLPDVPAPLLGSASTVDYLIKVANELRIPNAAGNGRLDDVHWSFGVKFYTIR